MPPCFVQYNENSKQSVFRVDTNLKVDYNNNRKLQILDLTIEYRCSKSGIFEQNVSVVMFIVIIVIAISYIIPHCMELSSQILEEQIEFWKGGIGNV